LQESGFIIDKENDFILRPEFVSLKVGWKQSDVLLKLDFINDIPVHFGEIVQTPVFCRTDSVRNMLSNKLGALFRYAAKDVSDIREIALHEHFNWTDILKEARQKDGGLELSYIAEILKGMTQKYFDTINWVKKPSWEDFQDDIQTIVKDMILASENSLAM
jgi:hypothetical protein